MAGKNNVAIIHNWLTVRGGSEKVLFELIKMFPDAPVYTLVYDKNKFPELKNTVVKTSWLQNIPWFRMHHELFPPLRYLIWRYTYLRGFDLVITSSSSENKAVRVVGGNHIAYIHTPPHYYWRYFKDYLKNPGFGKLNFLARIFLKILNPSLRYFDKKAAQNPDLLLANSKFIAQQIKKYYGRDSLVLYPPIDLNRFTKPSTSKYQPPISNYYLSYGRQTVFKNIDLIIQTFKNQEDHLIIAGRGPENSNLKKLVGDSTNILFEDSPSDEQLEVLVQNAKACIFANEEDFGITWAESMAAGTPVICFGSGGALETVQEGVSGIFFKNQTSESLSSALLKFESEKWDSSRIRSCVDKFSDRQFIKNLSKIINDFGLTTD